MIRFNLEKNYLLFDKEIYEFIEIFRKSVIEKSVNSYPQKKKMQIYFSQHSLIDKYLRNDSLNLK